MTKAVAAKTKARKARADRPAPIDTEVYETIQVPSATGPRTIRYVLRPAAKANAPLLVILHGHSFNAAAARFSDPDWNVLCPIDDFGFRGAGSWFLGEDGDLFWLDGMRLLLAHVRAQCGYRQLYFWGSSMGGYGAILHGARNRAKAVYANCPQTRLLGSTYSKGGMEKCFAPIFGAEGAAHRLNDLRLVIKPGLETTFFLSHYRFDSPDYLREQCLPFIDRLTRAEVSFYLEVRPAKGHAVTHTIRESVGLFAKFL